MRHTLVSIGSLLTMNAGSWVATIVTTGTLLPFVKEVQTHAQPTRYVEVADLPLAPHSLDHKHYLMWAETVTL